MNFWTFKEDHSRGYYMPVSDKAARDHGGQLVRGFFFLILNLCKLAWTLLLGIGSLLIAAIRWLWKLKKG